jgi:hypothetical protein
MGDLSCRSALTIHRGTANLSQQSRLVLGLGVDAPTANNAERDDLRFTRAFWASMPEDLRRRFACRVVDELEPIHQAHGIEGRMMGEA